MPRALERVTTSHGNRENWEPLNFALKKPVEVDEARKIMARQTVVFTTVYGLASINVGGTIAESLTLGWATGKLVDLHKRGSCKYVHVKVLYY